MTEENKVDLQINDDVTSEVPQSEAPIGTEQLAMPKVICEKHGDVGPHHFTLHAPEFGYDQVHLCLICAFEYATMICSPVRAEYPEGELKVEGGTEEDKATPDVEEKKDE
jgi:hypothetical protein